MQQATARLTEIWLEGRDLVGRVRSPIQPGPGQYALAQRVDASQAVLPAVLFSGGQTADGFIVAPPLPDGWRPGDDLLLKSPIGKGFCLPPGVNRLALLAMKYTTRRLLPLAEFGLKNGASVTLACGNQSAALPFTDLPAAIEIVPLDDLSDLLNWADFIAIDLAFNDLSRFRQLLNVEPGSSLPCPAQVLVHTIMPCAGMADCGVCAVEMKHGWKLACKDGPVFELNNLEW